MTQKQELAKAFAEVVADIKAKSKTVSGPQLVNAAIDLHQLAHGTKGEILALLFLKPEDEIQGIINLAAIQLATLATERTMERLQAEEN